MFIVNRCKREIEARNQWTHLEVMAVEEAPAKDPVLKRVRFEKSTACCMPMGTKGCPLASLA